jgi:hypothetical protein
MKNLSSLFLTFSLRALLYAMFPVAFGKNALDISMIFELVEAVLSWGTVRAVISVGAEGCVFCNRSRLSWLNTSMVNVITNCRFLC